MILLLFLAVALYITYEIWKDTEELTTTIIAVIFLHVVAFGSLMFFSFACQEETHRTNRSYDIYSIRRENMVNGSFFLGSGIINTSRDYIFYYKDTDQFFRLGSVPVYNSRIKECEVTDGFVPHAKYQIIHYDTPFWYAFGLGCSSEQMSMTDLYIPAGTIIQEFKL